MPNLNDTQRVLLATAAQRESGSIYPLTDTLQDGGTKITKAITALVKAGYAEERETNSASEMCRTDGDIRYGVYATAAGLAAIGIGHTAQNAAPSPTPTSAERRTKAALVIELLGRADGATLADLTDATGWLPHTTRAALTALRKKGHGIERGKRDGTTFYRIGGAA